MRRDVEPVGSGNDGVVQVLQRQPAVGERLAQLLLLGQHVRSESVDVREHRPDRTDVAVDVGRDLREDLLQRRERRPDVRAVRCDQRAGRRQVVGEGLELLVVSGGLAGERAGVVEQARDRRPVVRERSQSLPERQDGRVEARPVVSHGLGHVMHELTEDAVLVRTGGPERLDQLVQQGDRLVHRLGQRGSAHRDHRVVRHDRPAPVHRIELDVAVIDNVGRHQRGDRMSRDLDVGIDLHLDGHIGRVRRDGCHRSRRGSRARRRGSRRRHRGPRGSQP